MITGTAYVLRTCAADMTSRAGTFTWPRSGHVEAPDWEPTDMCGNGLHGFLWGEGGGDLADWSESAVWVVAKVEQWIDLGGKVKFPRAEVVFAGDRRAATDTIRALGATGAVIGVTLTGGTYSTLTGGDRSTLTGGDRSTLTGGDGSTLTGGDRSTLTGGDHSTITGGAGSTLIGGFRSSLTGGDNSTLTAGADSKITGGIDSRLTAKWWDGKRIRAITGVCGDDLKADTTYRVEAGKWVEVNEAEKR